MFGRNFPRNRDEAPLSHQPGYMPCLIETLEDRRLLSASVVHHAVTHAAHHATAKHAALKHAVTKTKTASAAVSTTASSTTSSGSTTSTGEGNDDPGMIENTITFSQAPSAVQKGLVTLAAKDSLAVPTSTQTVYLGNSNGIETYTLDYTASGSSTRITVDQNGSAVTTPAQSTTTWATLDGAGTGSEAAAAAEISEIAMALTLTAPTATTEVYVITPSTGAAIYTVHLSAASTTSTGNPPIGRGYDLGTISVDANGIPTGNQSLPFNVIPTPIQNGFNINLPSGATALATTSTQAVNVRTIDGVTLFSTTFTSSGTSTTITVNSAGALTSLPTDTTASFSDIPLAAQTELQTLATADGATGTISSGQTVQVYTEANGTVIYTVSVSATNSSSQAVTVTISVDANGNPTVAPHQDGGGCGGGGSGFRDGADALLTGGWDGADFGAVDFGLASYGGGNL